MKIAFLLLAALGIGSTARAQELPTEPMIFTTESYPPYIYQEANGAYRGIAVDQIALLMRDAGLPFTIEMMPWARALATAETQPMHCVFAAARTPEREQRFKWVAPLLVDRSLLVTRASSGIRATTVDEAKRHTVGTHRGDYTEVLLQNLGFPKIDLSADVDITLRKLQEGRIDMMPMSEGSYEKLQAEGKGLEAVLVLAETSLGIACNRSVPDDVIDRMQGGLDRLAAGGVQAEIMRRYGVTPPR